MKDKASKLDAHEAELAEWFRKEKLTLAQAVARLAERKVKVSPSRLSAWWAKYQNDALQVEAETKLYADLASGSRIAKEVGDMAADAPTQIATLIKLVERLILQVSVRGELPTQLKVIPALIAPCLEWSRQQQSADKLALDRERYANTLKTKIEAGLDELAQQIGDNREARDLYDQFRAVVTAATQKA